MSETRFTPGPWTVGSYSQHVFANNAKVGGQAMVCEVRGFGYLTGKGHGGLGLSMGEAVAIQSANSHLIAAAPALYAALVEAEAFINRHSGGGETDLRAKLTAAIAKARGES